jgi:hypothetical protein
MGVSQDDPVHLAAFVSCLEETNALGFDSALAKETGNSFFNTSGRQITAALSGQCKGNVPDANPWLGPQSAT